MNCKICGSSTFCSTSGITYCTECNSQIEDTQTETAAETAPNRDLLSSPSVKKTAKDQAQEYTNWITAECFNHIIFMQVTSLIKLGASPKLKKTVLYIWSKYLEKCEIVFRTDYQAEDGTPHLGPVPSKRDINILYGDRKRLRRKRRNSEISSVSGATSAEESIVNDSDSASDTNSTASSVIISLKKKYSSHTRKLYRKSSLKASNKAKYRRQIFNMTLPKTLSFCYLGLLYTEDQLALSDFIRFICEEKVPYINIIDKLPESVKLEEIIDYNIFLTYTVPDACSILQTSLQIAKFLKLPKFKEPSIFLAVSRFVKDLNLPDDIKPVVKVLVEKYKEKSSISERVPLDYQALAFIIVALKLLFILDGKFEFEHSNTMNKLNAVHPDNNYFVWREWKEQMSLKEYLFLYENPGYSVINKLNSLSADTIISKCQFTCLKSPTAEEEQNRRDNLVLKREIKDILSSLVTIPDKSEVASTSFPLTNETNCFMREWRTLPMYKETKEIDFTLLQKDFTPCSLHFNPLQFDKDDDELSYLLMTSLYLHETVLETKFSHFTSNIHQVIATTSRYWFFKHLRSGKSDLSSEWFDKLPSSFKWLINFISKYVCCKNINLYKEVSQIEKVLFLKSKTVHSKSLSEYNNKIIVSL